MPRSVLQKMSFDRWHGGPNRRTGDTNSNRGSNRRFQETFGSEPTKNRFEPVDPVKRTGVQSSMPNPSEKYGGAMCRRQAAHCTDFSNHRCPIHRKKYGDAMCRRRATHCTDLSNHRCPIIDAKSIGKNMEVQCAAGGRHIAPTFPIIDSQSIGQK